MFKVISLNRGEPEGTEDIEESISAFGKTRYDGGSGGRRIRSAGGGATVAVSGGRYG
jgi:hypothetical protein